MIQPSRLPVSAFRKRAALLLSFLLIMASIINANAGKITPHDKVKENTTHRKSAFAAPVISYASPQTFLTGKPIAPLAPTSSGVGVQGFGTPVIIGSGFSQPTDVAVDVAGNVYVADHTNSQVKKIPVGGGAPVIIGSGFSAPYGVAVDQAGNVYVADFNSPSIKKIAVGGAVTVIGTGFSTPPALAVDAAGNVYVADQGNNALKKIPFNGLPIVTLATGLSSPRGVAVDATGNVYVSEYLTSTVKMLPAAGGAFVTLGSGFNHPAGIDVDATGNVYVADQGNNALKIIPADGSAPVIIGSGFSNPFGVTTDAAGIVYIDDFSNNAIKKMTPNGGYYLGDALPAGLAFNQATGVISGTPTAVSASKNYTITGYNLSGNTQVVVNITVTPPPPAPTISYTSPQSYLINSVISPLAPTSNGVAASAYSTTTTNVSPGITSSMGSVVDAAGNLYVTDYDAGLLNKYPVGGGVATTLASGLSGPKGIAVDAAGNIYVAEYGAGLVSKIPAGGGAKVNLGSGFSQPLKVAVDAAGNVYVADAGNFAVKKIPAGNGTPITLVSFVPVRGVAVDAIGNVYYSDNSSTQVQMLPVGGEATVNIGSGFLNPYDVAIDAGGNLFVLDMGNKVIKEVPAGNGTPVVVGPVFATPYGLTTDGAGNIYVDDYNIGVRKFSPVGGYFLNLFLPAGLSFDSNTGIISGTTTALSPATNYKVTGYNAGGSTTALLNITIALPPPPVISYTSPQSFIINKAITPVSPVNSGVAAAAYSNSTINLTPGTTSSIAAVVDAAGNLYVSDYDNAIVQKYPVGGGAAVTVASGLIHPRGIAVDAAGNVYVAEYAGNSVKMFPAGGGAAITLGFGFNQPFKVALDAAGNVYVADAGNFSIKKIPAGNGNPVTLVSGLTVRGLAVDPSGNVYFADYGNNLVKMIPAGGGSIVNIGSGFTSPYDVELDAAGNVFVLESGSNRVKKVSAGGGSPVVVGPAFTTPNGVTVDGLGNVYVADYNIGVRKFAPTGGYFLSAYLPGGLSFDSNTGIISGTPTALSPPTNYNITAYNIGGGATAVLNAAVTLPPPPVISYNGPQTYINGVAITSLAPANSGVAAPAYGVPVTIGSGFSGPIGVATDAAGNVYVADRSNNAVKKIPAGGGVPVVIGSGFNLPYSVAVDGGGNVFVADYGNNAIKKIPADGSAIVSIGSGLSHPTGVAVDRQGYVYVADYGNNAIKRVAPGLGGSFNILGSGFNFATGVTVDAAGNVYIADSGNDVIKKMNGGSGTPFVIASGFSGPSGVSVDAEGNVFVADYGNQQIKKILAVNGAVVTVAAGLSGPYSSAVDASGIVYIANFSNNTVKKIVPVGGYYLGSQLPKGLSLNNTSGAISGVPIIATQPTDYTITAYNTGGGSSTIVNIQTRLAAPATVSYSSPQIFSVGNTITPLAPVSSGVATAGVGNTFLIGAGMTNSKELATDVAGNVYVTDANAIKKIPVNGGPTTIFASGFNMPQGLTFDAVGNLYVADYGNNAVKKIPANGGAPVVLGPAISGPWDVAVDAVGNVYVSAYFNNSIIKIPVGGGGNITYATGFTNPEGIALDVAGNLYIADAGNNAIKKVPAAGGVAVTLGSGFKTPYDVAVDVAGNVYVADEGNFDVKKIPAGGGAVVSIGSIFNGYPYGVTVDAAGVVYVADNAGGAQVKKIVPNGGYFINLPLPAGLSFDGVTGIISGTPTAVTLPANFIVTAYNNGGGTSAGFNIEVRSVPPATISYASPKNFIIDTLVTSFAPVSTGVSAPGYGTGTNTIATGLNGPTKVAVDAAGNLYVADYLGSTVKKYPVGGGAAVILGSGFLAPSGVAVDISGNVYVGDYGHNAVKKIPVGGGAPVTIGSGFTNPMGVAVDAAGNVYVADYGNNAAKMIPVGGGATVTLTTAVFNPFGITVDNAGNVFVTNTAGNEIVKLPAGGGALVALPQVFNAPTDVKVDAFGNIYVADFKNNTIKRIPAAGGAAVAIGSGFNAPKGLAVDANGNVFVADYNNNALKQIIPTGGYYISPTLPVGLKFSNVTGVITGTPTVLTPASDYSVIAYNGGGSTTTTANFRVATNTYLSNLLISAGTLSPAFVKTSTSYMAVVPYAISSVAFTPTATDPAASVKVNGGAVVSGQASAPVTLNVGLNAIPVVVTSPDGVTTTTYTISVTRANALPPVVNTLSATAVTVNTATLNGDADDQGTNTTVNFVYGTSPTLSGTVKTVAATTGSNIDAGDGKTSVSLDAKSLLSKTQYYFMVSATNPGGTVNGAILSFTTLPSSNAILSGLVPNAGTLSPVFASQTISYALQVPNDTTSISFVPTTANAFSTVTVNGVTVLSGSASAGIPLAVGANAITTIVTAQDGTTKKTYTVNVTRLPPPPPLATTLNATSIAVVGATLNGQVNDNGLATTVSFVYGTTPTLTGVNKTVSATTGGTIPAGTGNTAVAVNITGLVSFASYYYMVVATNSTGTTKGAINSFNTLPSANAILSGLSASAGALSPVFANGTVNYTITVPYTTASTTITPTTANVYSTVVVEGITLSSGSASPAIQLNTGSNLITTVVTAQDGTTSKTYKITITKLVPPVPLVTTNAASSITANSVTLSGQVDDNGSNTTVSFMYGTSPALSTGNITATTGGVVNAGMGATAAALTLTGLKSNTQYYYRCLAINAIGVGFGNILSFVTPASGNSMLSGLITSSGPLVPAFASGTTNYSLSVPNATGAITVTPTTAYSTASVTVNGIPATSGSASGNIALSVGLNIITTVVTAEDGFSKTSYTINVSRAAGAPVVNTGNASAVAVATATLNGQVNDNGNTTTVSFIYGTSPTLAGATTTVAATTGGSVNAGSGNTAAAVNIVGLASKTQYYYMASATNSAGTTNGSILSFTTLPSSNAILSGLSESVGTLSPVFAQQTINYTASVANATASVTVKPITSNAFSTVKVNGSAVTSGTSSAAIPLVVGANVITIIVTAQDGTTTKTYKITVTRATGSLNETYYSVTKPIDSLQNSVDDGVLVHPALSPNGDGINDVLAITGINAYPNNTVTIINRNGVVVYETKGYDNASKVFDGHSNRTGAMQQPGTYFYTLDYKSGDEVKHKTGFIVLKY